MSRTYLEKTRTVYKIGNSGPGVVLMHEVPGLTPNVLRLALLLSQRGFRVALPSLFGTDGEAPSDAIDAEILLKMCVSAEFAVFAANGSSPVVNWLRELCKAFASETGGPVAALGLCITGGFALSLTLDSSGMVRAPVMSEPSLPFPMPFTNNGAALHLTPTEQETVQKKPPPCMALRFTGDYRCKVERFDAYEALLGNQLTRIEISSPDPKFGIGADAHSVLTQELSDVHEHPTWAAFEAVIDFLKTQLPAATGT